MSVPEIILMVKNGIVDAVSIPEGVTVIIRDYDYFPDEDHLTVSDNDGRKYLEILFDHYDSIVEN